MKISLIQKYCSLTTIKFVSVLKKKKNWMAKLKTLKYLFVTFACCVELQAKVKWIWFVSNVKTYFVQYTWIPTESQNY